FMVRRPDWIVVAAALLCVGGLCVFLLISRPTERATEVAPHNIGPLTVVLALLVVVALMVASRFTGETRVLALALAAGVFYGVTAGLLKVIAVEIRIGGIGEPFLHWALYAACVTGPPGFLLSQNALQHGRLASLALAVITTVDPLVAVA